MISSVASAPGWPTFRFEPPMDKLKFVWMVGSDGPKGVGTEELTARSCTCAGPGVEPSIAVADTMPLASEIKDAPLNETDCAVCQTTVTLANGLPLEASTRAESRTGRSELGSPDCPLPLRMRSLAGWPAPGAGAGVPAPPTVTLNGVV